MFRKRSCIYERVHYYSQTCQYGHSAYVAVSRWLERGEMLARARCTLCGHRGAADLVMVPVRTTGFKSGTSSFMVGLNVIKV